MSLQSSSSRRGVTLATSALIASARAGNVGASTFARGGHTAKVTQADVLRLFAPHFHQYSTAASSSSPLSQRQTRKPNNRLALVRRHQHVQSQETGTASDNFPPPSTGRTSTASKQKERASRSNSSSPTAGLYQKAGSVPAKGEQASTSHISRVVPVSSVTASELGADANQTSSSQVQLTEKQEKALAAKDAEERWKKLPVYKRAWAKVKEEAAHYWHGTKLLAKEVSISSRLLRRLMLGYQLTRREHRQLKRTTADLLRLIPFLPFIIIPFGELLLPVAIKIFPNMLPSTFESKFAVEEKRRRLLKVRLEMAKFLQETVKEGGITAADKVRTSDEFKEFFRKVRSTGEAPSPQDTIRVAKLLENDLTLDNLTRPQLVSMCRYLQINAFGTDNYLRYQIRTKLNSIKRDDVQIASEGVDSMSLHELQSACQSRGILTQGRAEKLLQDELSQWIDLHVHQRISGVLLILSRAFDYVPSSAKGSDAENMSPLQSLELTLSSLPDTLLSEAELSVSKDAATNKQRLDVLNQQEELIEDEAEQEQAEEEARKADKERRRSVSERARLNREEREARSMLPAGEVDPAQEDARMTNEQLTELGEALSILSAKSSVLREREELAQLVKDMEASGVCGDGDKEKTGESSKPVQESTDAEQSSVSAAMSSTSRGLAKRVRKMLEKIDAQLEDYDRDVGSRMNIIEASPSGKISVDDLEQALRLIKHRPEEEILERLVDKLDVDNDGLVPLADVVELARHESGLGIVRDDNIRGIRAEGDALRDERKSGGLKREDIIEQ